MKTIRPNLPARRRRLSDRPDRGAILIVAALFAAFIAIAIGSYIQLGNTSMQLAHRAFYANSAMNLAETGLEEAVWSLNQQVAGNGSAWSNWSGDASLRRRTFTFANDDLGSGATGSVRVLAQDTGTNNPTVVARARITPIKGRRIEKWISIKLGRSSYFEYGLLAKNWIKISGNQTFVDSYDSRNGPYDPASGSYLSDPPSGDNRNDAAPVGSPSVLTDTVTVGNADILGYVSIGSSDYSSLDVGPNGTIGPYGTNQGKVDYDNVITNFSASLDDVTAPTGGTTVSSISLNSTPGTIGTTGSSTSYRMDTISLSGNASTVLTIRGDVTIVLTATAGTALSVTGNDASIQIEPGGSLQIYTEADVALGGGGLVNPNEPIDFQLWGTAATGDSQSISINGNGVLSGVVYAPNADVSLSGGGSSGNIFGAIVGETINVSSNFHYDEALADITQNKRYAIEYWDELTNAADRNFWDALSSF